MLRAQVSIEGPKAGRSPLGLARRMAGGACGGVLAAIVMMASVQCGGPESSAAGPSSGTGGSGGAVDGLQACIDLWDLVGKYCPPPPPHSEGVEQCKTEFRNAGSECHDEISAEYVCALAETAAIIETDPCPDWPAKCGSLTSQTRACILELGCLPATGCFHENTGPNGEPACDCVEYCRGSEYRSRCWDAGTASSCDCLVDDASVGTCDGGPEPFCSVKLWNGCCNQYFEL